MHFSSVRFAGHSIVPVNTTTSLGCFRVMKHLKLFLSHRNQPLITDLVITNGSQIQDPYWSVFKQLTSCPFIFKFDHCPVVLESHSKCEYSITCKEFHYSPCIYLPLKWRYYFYVCFVPGLTFKSFCGYIGIERDKKSNELVLVFKIPSSSTIFFIPITTSMLSCKAATIV